jgi:anti-anti-sigma regulatory factor
MFKPAIRVKVRDGYLVGEFWDCYRLEPEPVQDLRRHYDAHLSAGGKPGIAVDLSGVGFAGSTALGGFVAMRKSGIRLVFFNVEPIVLEVFRVGGLEKLFCFAVDENGAIEELERSGAVPRTSQATPDVSAANSAPRRAGASAPLRRIRKEP